jgi:hypothetical protein
MKPMPDGLSALRGPRCRITRALLTASLALLLGACAAGRIAAPGASYASPEAAIRAIAAQDLTRALTATARIEISTPAERYPLKAALLMKRPASLRLESIPLLGPPDFFLAMDGRELRAFLPGKGIFYTGRATAWSISRFLSLALPPEAIVSLLTGHPPAEQENASTLWRGEQEEGLYRIDQIQAVRKVRSLWIDPDGDRLIRIQVYAGGDSPLSYAAEFEEHVRVGNAFLPQRLKITGEGLSFALRYTEIRLLEDEDAAAFILPVPEGVIPTPLE